MESDSTNNQPSAADAPHVIEQALLAYYTQCDSEWSAKADRDDLQADAFRAGYRARQPHIDALQRQLTKERDEARQEAKNKTALANDYKYHLENRTRDITELIAERDSLAGQVERVKSALIESLEARTKNMEGYSYFDANFGVSQDDYEEIADAVVAALSTPRAEPVAESGLSQAAEKDNEWLDEDAGVDTQDARAI